MNNRKVIVIGAGPAGLMAAGQAAAAGAETTVMEKMKRPGLKLGITGKGRCNITNVAEISDFIGHFGKTGRFLRQSFAQYFNTDLMDFLEFHGLPLVTERGGRVFPASGKALDVLKVLLKWMEKEKVQIETGAPVDKLVIQKNQIIGVLSGKEKILCDAVIVATGGASYPATGSTGDGYRLAASAGHAIIPVRQALVPLETSGDETGMMTGLNLRNVNVHMFVNGKKKRTEFGEITFTDFGVSGPTVLSMSGDVVDHLRAGQKVFFSLDLKSALDDKKLEARLLRDIASKGKENIDSLLRGLLPGGMVATALKILKFSPDLPLSRFSGQDRRALRSWLKDFKLEITGFRPFEEAIISAGGVDTKELDPRTMESKIVKGLFFAGEVLNLQADTGGYNLQAAFSTGWVAGRSAAEG